jgi:hypothetical protein
MMRGAAGSGGSFWGRQDPEEEGLDHAKDIRSVIAHFPEAGRRVPSSAQTLDRGANVRLVSALQKAVLLIGLLRTYFTGSKAENESEGARRLALRVGCL